MTSGTLSNNGDTIHNRGRIDERPRSLFKSNSSLPFIPSLYNDGVQRELKSKIIERATLNHGVCLLCALGKSRFGFINNKFRQESWLMILESQIIIPEGKSKTEGTIHTDENQIKLDVNRSFGFITDDMQKGKLRELLLENIVRFFRKYPKLRYYQGYHDIVSVFVMVYCHSNSNRSLNLSDSDETISEEQHSGNIIIANKNLFYCIEMFSLLYLRDFMMDSLDFPIDQIKLIPYIINENDEQLYKKLHLSQIEPFFAIASILTLFSHDIKPSIKEQDDESTLIYQIFDLIISAQSLFIPLVIYANLIIANKDKLLQEYDNNIGNFENEVDLVHAIIQQVIVQNNGEGSLWPNVMEQTRENYCNRSNNISKLVAKMINKGSPLRNTASNVPFNKVYDMHNIEKLIDTQIKLNEKQKIIQNSKKKHNKRSGILLLRMSVLIGVLAIVTNAYLNSSSSEFALFLSKKIPPINSFSILVQKLLRFIKDQYRPTN